MWTVSNCQSSHPYQVWGSWLGIPGGGGEMKTLREKKNDATKMELNDSPGELLIQSGGDCIQGLDKTEGQVFENP